MSTTASDGTYYTLDESRCGDFPECHTEPPTCGHAEVEED